MKKFKIGYRITDHYYGGLSGSVVVESDNPESITDGSVWDSIRKNYSDGENLMLCNLHSFKITSFQEVAGISESLLRRMG